LTAYQNISKGIALLHLSNYHSGERIDLTEPKDALLPEAKQKGGETN